jgi:hypothetical protein
MTLEDFVEEAIIKINQSGNKEHVVINIFNEIDKLIYSIDKKPISNNDKLYILENIYNYLVNPKKIINGVTYFEKSADNKYYLTLIGNAINKLKK